ncbi:hypothetical protein Hdeb2414_s0212g00834861 [Helianthus debilis subsp. tardiflorus]
MEETSSHRQTGPRPNIGNNFQVEGIPEDASDDNEVQSNRVNEPITPGIRQEIPVHSILPLGETPISWYVRSQGALNAVYTQLCAHTAPQTQSRRPGSRAHALNVRARLTLKTRRYTPDLRRDMSIPNLRAVDESIETSHTPTEEHQFTLGWVLTKTPTPVKTIQPTV